MMRDMPGSEIEVMCGPQALSAVARCDDRFSYAAVGSAVRCGNRCGKICGRWKYFAVVEFADGATERVALNRVFELVSET